MELSALCGPLDPRPRPRQHNLPPADQTRVKPEGTRHVPSCSGWSESAVKPENQESKLKQSVGWSGGGVGPTPSLPVSGRTRGGGGGTGEQGLGDRRGTADAGEEAWRKRHAAALGERPPPRVRGSGQEAAAHCKNKPSGLPRLGTFCGARAPGATPATLGCQPGVRCLLSEILPSPGLGLQGSTPPAPQCVRLGQ